MAGTHPSPILVTGVLYVANFQINYNITQEKLNSQMKSYTSHDSDKKLQVFNFFYSYIYAIQRIA